jgi:hypothetical protein
VEPLAAWEKVFIDVDSSYAEIDPNHAAIGCVSCHGGVEPVVADTSSTNSLWMAMMEAHQAEVFYTESGEPDRERLDEKLMRRDPSVDAFQSCAGSSCHQTIVELNENSMHTQLHGEKHKVALRNGYSSWEDCPQSLKDGFEGECANCHTTCGQCHVSRPNSVHHGLLDSHRFKKTPEIENNCTACHGSRIGNDYNGSLDGVTRDVHNEAGFDCFFCHTEDLHGDGTAYESRLNVDGIPQCKDCHNNRRHRISNIYHEAHWPNSGTTDQAYLSCYVCHSQPYANCVNCHSGGVWSSENNEGYAEYEDFKIGHNSGNWPSHPADDEEWVVVRHVPVIKDGFRELGWPNQESWAAWETWEMATPHNIRKYTDQTEIAEDGLATNANCWLNCHAIGENQIENSERFLWNSHLDSLKNHITGIEDNPEQYMQANENVVADDHLPTYWYRP